MKELLIDKNTNINKIKNKEEYEKLILNTKVYPFMLKDFKNVKELTIIRNKKGFNVYNETHINELPFKEKLEKLTLIDIYHFGRYKNCNKNFYQLNLPNLKTIEFVGKVNCCNNYYLSYCHSLKEIIINSNNFNKSFYCSSTSLKRIILKMDKEYKVDLDYIPNNITIQTNNSTINPYIDYYRGGVSTKINENLGKINTLNYYGREMVENKSVTIPDYITNINELSDYNYVYNNEIESISFNLNLLKTQKAKIWLLKNFDLKKLNQIIVRNNNEMSLFPNIVINIKDYGEIKDLYIVDNKLYVIYNNLVITVDETGKQLIKKIEFQKNEDIKDIEDTFKAYKVDELENYFYYKKLLENLKDNSDIELKNAMNIVGDRIIKKLTRK